MRILRAFGAFFRGYARGASEVRREQGIPTFSERVAAAPRVLISLPFKILGFLIWVATLVGFYSLMVWITGCS